MNPKTGKIYNTTKSRLKKHLKGADWGFSSITPLEVQKIEVWMRNNYSFNSMVNSMTILKKFFRLAIADGILFNNPFDTVKIQRYTAGNREALDVNELKQLWLNSLDLLTPHQKNVLERYLFSCHTGLRQSEIEIFDTRINYQNGIIKLDTIKGRRYNKKVNFKPPAFVNDLINGKRERVFPPMESALLNKTLKIVAKIAGVDKYLKFHSGRDTFATLYLRLGGNIGDLKDLLAHTSITTT